MSFARTMASLSKNSISSTEVLSGLHVSVRPPEPCSCALAVLADHTSPSPSDPESLKLLLRSPPFTTWVAVRRSVAQAISWRNLQQRGGPQSRSTGPQWLGAPRRMGGMCRPYPRVSTCGGTCCGPVSLSNIRIVSPYIWRWKILITNAFVSSALSLKKWAWGRLSALMPVSRSGSLLPLLRGGVYRIS